MEKVNVLDHGYVGLVEAWGSDERIIEAARMSTSGGFVSWDAYEGHPKGDAGLLSYLWKNEHATPFEMVGLTFEVLAPIFVLREWHRHRVPFGYNEASARYAPLPDVNYRPSVERLFMSAGANKQAASTGLELTLENAATWDERVEHFYDLAQELYEFGLTVGIPKELARIVLPVGRYSKMRATGNLRGWLAFMKLRAHPRAQYEIRVYADAIGKFIAEKFPRTWHLYQEGKG
jgi:thymidylate synthase (FAD)